MLDSARHRTPAPEDREDVKSSEEKQFGNLRRLAGKAITRYGLVGPGDRVALGLSGGVDSLALLELLARRRRYLPFTYDLVAIHVNVRSIPYEIDRAWTQGFCDDLGVPFLWRDLDVDFEGYGKPSPCFLCSRARRRELFTVAREHGCNRLALGHHQDDAVQTLLLNMVYNSAMSAMPPRLSMFDGTLDIIRPFILVPEKQIKAYARVRAYPAQKALCPYGDASRRAGMKEIVRQLEGMHRKARRNIFHAMSNIQKEYLPPAADEDS